MLSTEALEGGLSARVLYGRHDLAALGVKYRTFRKYISDLQRGAPPVRQPPKSSVRMEATARSLMALLDIAFTPKATDGIVTELCRDRLGKVPGKVVGRKIPARSAGLARRLDAFLSLAFERGVVDRLTRALWRWRFDGWNLDADKLLTGPPANVAGWVESETIPPDYIPMTQAIRRAKGSPYYTGARNGRAVKMWCYRLAKQSMNSPHPPVKCRGRLYLRQSIHPAFFVPVAGGRDRRVSAEEAT